MTLKEASNWDLFEELRSRGFRTDLLWCREDVDNNREWINEDREEDKKIPELTDEQKDDILESLSFEYYTQRINEDIFDKILQEYDTED